MRSKVLAAIYEEPPVNPNECHLQDFLRLEEYGKKMGTLARDGLIS